MPQKVRVSYKAVFFLNFQLLSVAFRSFQLPSMIAAFSLQRGLLIGADYL